ncbi:hypothetical protein [Henriciella sp.]|uniref:hypothetical protein n=1 Tax=Henriciella sp. TaxID=1968823 RepID=UPI00262FFDD1|nr:hypothetical protein [Henriciella sp.]
MPYNFDDDIIFDDFHDQHFDDLLEEECASVLARICASTEALLGEAPVRSMLQKAAEQVHGSKHFGSSDDLEEEFCLQGSYREAASAIARLGVLSVNGVPLQYKSYNLKMYAMLGVVDIGSGEPEEIQAFVEEVVSWANALVATVAREETEPFMCFFAKAASARLDLDMGRNPLIDEFAALASLARHPHSEPLTNDLLELPYKTIQNLISAKTLERVGDRKLAHKSAHEWMRKQWPYDILYPSRVFAAPIAAAVSETIEEPVFVPVIAEAKNIVAEPYLPEQRHEDGYHIQLADRELTIIDYWEALSLLRANPSARVSTPHLPQYLPLSKNWRVFEKAVIDGMIANEQPARFEGAGDKPAGLCEQFLRIVEKHPKVAAHRVGHTKKMLRYKCSNGQEVAVEKRPDRPLIYVVASSKNETKFADRTIRRKGPGPDGRNSNLNAMDAFVGTELLVLRPDTLEQARSILDDLAMR